MEQVPDKPYEDEIEKIKKRAEIMRRNPRATNEGWAEYLDRVLPPNKRPQPSLGDNS